MSPAQSCNHRRRISAATKWQLLLLLATTLCLSSPAVFAQGKTGKPAKNNSKAETAEKAEKPQKQAESEVTVDDSPREPATVDEAAKVLDLRTFPVMEGGEIQGGRRLGGLNYEVKTSVKALFEYQREQLGKLGWKELPGSQFDAAYASARFTKAGYIAYVYVSENTGDPKKAGWAQLTIGNYGNILTGSLPVPGGVKPFYPDIASASYITETPVPEIAAACHELLVAKGWIPYGTASSDPESPMQYYKRNAIRLHSWVSKAPAQGNKTVIRYSTELLSADLPMPPDAPDPRYDDGQKTVRFDWPGLDPAPVVEFYQAALSTLGWKATTEQPVGNGKGEDFQVYRNPQEDMISLDLKRFSDITRVTVQHFTLAEIDEIERQSKEQAERRQQELARKGLKIKSDDAPEVTSRDSKKPGMKKAPGIPDVLDGIEIPDVDELLKDPKKAKDLADKITKAAEKKNASTKVATTKEGVTLKVADIPVPKDATGVEYSKTTKMIDITSPADVETLAKFYTDKLSEAGWVKAGNGLVDEDSAILKFENAGATITIFIEREDDVSEVNVMTKGLAWDTVPKSRKAPERAERDKPAVGNSKQPAAGSQKPRFVAGPKITPAELKQDRVTLVINEKSIKLGYGVGYQTVQNDETITEVLLTAKPIAVDKIVALLAQGKDAGDVAGFEPHLKLRYDKSGALSYLFMYADGLSINQSGQGDDVISAEIEIKDGGAKGKAIMKEPGKLFDMRYRIDATFSVKLANRPTGEAGGVPAGVETETVGVGLVAGDDVDDLPFPLEHTERFSSSSEYRKSVQGVVAAGLSQVVDFYRKELAAKGWKENVRAAKVTKDEAQLAFQGPEGALSVKLKKQDDATSISLANRSQEKAKAAGILPQANRARLILANASDKQAVLLINGKEYKIAAGVGAKDPKDGTSLHVLPGKYNLTFKVAGRADQTEELNIVVDETWGVIVLPTGGHIADQLY
ncbi:MAG: hypothetical protein EXS05_21330 [Planctomycetaceae bacterium]|nr:hypothetical protein [Planctomycetaceae bacterium]